MQLKIARQVFLGVQWGVDSWDEAPLWCDILLARVGTAPVCWNLPSLPADGRGRGRQEFVRLLGARLGGGKDCLAAMGFCGACHPLLSIDELDRELSWAVRNPWSTGLGDVFDRTPALLMPRMADTQRPLALEAYRRHGFACIGVASEGGMRLWRASPDITAVSFFRIPVAADGTARRGLPARGDLFLVLDLAGLASPRSLQAVLDTVVAPLLPLAAAFPGKGLEPGNATAHAPAGVRGSELFPTPLLRDKLGAAAALSRKRRKKPDEYQRLLALLSPGPFAEGAALPADEAKGSGRVPVAHMLGEVTLAGSDFDVKLFGGRFLGLSRRDEPLLPLRRALSFLRVGGRTMHFRSRGSFSFETEDGTGLREELALEGTADPGARLSIEYSFRDTSALLCIEADIRYPRVDDNAVVDECVPFAFLLREVEGTTAVVESRAPDGSSAGCTVREGEGWVAVPGVEQTVALPGGTSLVVRWSEEARRWGLPYFRVSRCLGRRRGLEMSPFGCAAGLAGRWLSGRREKLSLLLGVTGA